MAGNYGTLYHNWCNKVCDLSLLIICNSLLLSVISFENGGMMLLSNSGKYYSNT